jgi:hypothetical protein
MKLNHMCIEVFEQGSSYARIRAYHEPGEGNYSWSLDLKWNPAHKLFEILEVVECIVYSGENDTEQPCSETVAHAWYDMCLDEVTYYLNEQYGESLRR